MPDIVTRCCDCGVGTNVLGEWYAVNDAVWEEAWRGRHRYSWARCVPGQEVLCIGCLEQRLGRTLCAGDFTDAAVNKTKLCFTGGLMLRMSERMRDRLTATKSRILPVPNPDFVLPPLLDPYPQFARYAASLKRKRECCQDQLPDQPKRKRGRLKGSKDKQPRKPKLMPPI
jgi:hypothetical protein